MTKGGRAVFIISLVFLISGIGVLIVAGLGGASFHTMSQNIQLSDFSESYDAHEIDSLVLDAGMAHVRVIPGENFSVTAKNIIPGAFSCEVSGKTLHVREDVMDYWPTNLVSRVSYPWDNIPTSEITVTVPAGSALNSISGNVAAGRLRVESIEAGSAIFTADAGELYMTGGSFGQLEAFVSAGTANIESEITDTARLHCDVGTISLQLPGCEEDYEISLQTDLGNISLGARSYTGSQTLNQGEGDITLSLDCSVGNIDVSFAD